MSGTSRAALLLALASCQATIDDPWLFFGQGSNSVGLIVALPDLRGSVDATGVSGALDGLSASETVDATSEYDVGVNGQHFVTDHWALGGQINWARANLKGADLYDARVNPGNFATMRAAGMARYYFGGATRYRPFLGGTLGWTPEVDVRFDVTYDTGEVEEVDFRGSSYWSTELLGGVAIQASDDVFFELGASYEVPLDPTQDNVTLDSPTTGTSVVDTEIEIGGPRLFFVLAYSF